MTVNTPTEDEGRGLRDRLAAIPRDRLVDEVVSRWDDMIRLEGEVANLRRRGREAELSSQSGGGDGALVGDLEENLVPASLPLDAASVLVGLVGAA